MRRRDQTHEASGVFLRGMKEKGLPVVCDDGHGNLVEALEQLGVFFRERDAKPSQRHRRELHAE